MKDYRSNELKLFVLANIIALLYLGNVINIQLVVDDDTYSKLIITIINSAMFSSIVYIFVLILDAVVSTKIKNTIVYWGFPLPGQIVFSKWKKKSQDERISQEDVLQRYKKIYDNMPSKGSTREYENVKWYGLYRKYEKDDKVFSSHRDYLMCRDMTTSIVEILILYIIMGNVVETVPVCKSGIIYLSIVYIIVNIATHSRGKRFVNNVLACDIYSDNENRQEIL